MRVKDLIKRLKDLKDLNLELNRLVERACKHAESFKGFEISKI